MSFYVVVNLCSLVLTTPGFDDLDLTGETTDDSGRTFDIEACDDETTWGSPVPVDVSVARWMTDGAVASTQNYEDREISFKVVVSAETSAELAAGEAALALRAGTSGLLTWTPPEGYGVAPASVLPVWTWHLDHVFDGVDERNLRRMYQVTMTAQPNVRSADLTVVDAVTTSTGSPTITEIDACTSTSGWTGSPHAPTTSGGAVKETAAALFNSRLGYSTYAITLTRTGSVTGLGATPYLMIDKSVSGGTTADVFVSIDGRYLTKVAQVGTVSYFQVPSGVTSFSELTIEATGRGKGTGNVVLSINDVSRSDQIGGVGSQRQLSRSLEVGGSVKTAGSIQVASPDSTPLDTVLVYTQPDNGQGFNPGLRQYWTSGNTVTPDATADSGEHETFPAFAPITYTIPGTVLPEATYAIIMRAKCDATGTMDITGDSSVDGYFAARSFLGGSMDFDFANTWTWGVIGAVTAPNQALPPESTLATVFTIVASDVPGAVLVDEVYLLDITHGDMTLVDVGGVATRLWIDAPDADPARNLPALYIGTQADRSDAASVPATQVKKMGNHNLDPSGMVLATVTDSVDNAVVTASFYRRWHTHAAA